MFEGNVPAGKVVGSSSISRASTAGTSRKASETCTATLSCKSPTAVPIRVGSFDLLAVLIFICTDRDGSTNIPVIGTVGIEVDEDMMVADKL